ncbi:hypothetical protein H6P81_020462 [Aristolochia fimbriata]|uniref:HAT C-terminal dimerisation domain-containing protein n=1 Tax=Aristolochia fimbriata TaxID=158543 RepID=A0AAV7DXR3_ARIFI|nr:hypothetical protein H6P81_020462 [Aristolochia fimbriata]
MNSLKYFFPKLYGDAAELHTLEVKSLLEELHKEYYEKYKSMSYGSQGGGTSIYEGSDLGSINDKYEIEDYNKFILNVTCSQLKSDLETYLDEECLPVPVHSSTNILEWWNHNKYKYPIMSLIARDILAIHVSTVASEAAFSNGGRVLNQYRSSLASGTVEAIVCAQDWFRCNMEVDIRDLDRVLISIPEKPCKLRISEKRKKKGRRSCDSEELGRMKAGLVFLPIPGRGHLASTVEFAKIINKDNRFSITILNMSTMLPGRPPLPASTHESITSSGLDISFVDLPAVEMPEETAVEAFISVFITRHAPLVKDFIIRLQSSSSSVRVVGLVVDLFATTVAEVGDELGIPTYVYFTSGAALLSLMLYLPTLDKKIESEFEDLEGTVDVPGLGSLPPLVMPSPVMKKKSPAYWWFVEHGRRFRYMRGIIANTFRALEPAALQAIEEGRCLPPESDGPTPPVFPVGPVLVVEEEDPSHPCLLWLNNQPPGSVVFLCFGSMGALPDAQAKEIALGLERSGRRFLWSIRSRRTPGFAPPVDSNPEEVLPEGFIERTKERGLVWPRWAPQTAILSHEAIGGFVSHCGWNSTLESLWSGVPMLAWPLAAEQRLNGFELAREIGAAVEMEVNYKDPAAVVQAAEVERGVRSLMGETVEGKRARDRALEMRGASRAAVNPGGSSFEALTRLTDQFLSSL